MLRRIWAGGQIGLVKSSDTSSGNIILDFAKSNNFKIILNDNASLSNPINLHEGQSGAIIIQQNEVGGNTLSFDTYWKWSDGVVDSISSTANSVNILMYYVISTNIIYTSIASDVK